MFSIEIEIQDSEVEKQYNHVHHAQSLIFLERARWELLKHLGFPGEELIKQDFFPVVTRIDVRYLREVTRGVIKVSCEEPRIEGRSMSITQKLSNPGGKVALEARVEFMFMSGQTRRGLCPPQPFVEALLALK